MDPSVCHGLMDGKREGPEVGSTIKGESSWVYNLDQGSMEIISVSKQCKYQTCCRMSLEWELLGRVPASQKR